MFKKCSYHQKKASLFIIYRYKTNYLKMQLPKTTNIYNLHPPQKKKKKKFIISGDFYVSEILKQLIWEVLA